MKKNTTKQYSSSRKETDKRAGGYKSRFAPEWWDLEKKGLAKVRVCKNCHAIYFDKHWHSWARVEDLSSKLRSSGVIETVCSECAFAAKTISGANDYEGEVILSGWRDSEEKREILQIVRNVGKRASARDPEDQIIKIEDLGAKLRVLTTENQLALSVGRQVDRARKGGKLEIKFSKNDAVARVIWNGGSASGK